MPPRHAYWTIILGGKPTAFRAHTRDELAPTLRQLQSRHPDAVMMWFARGRLWESQEQEREAAARRRPAEKRGPGWRPGGAHRDPRERFKIPRDEKRRRFAARARRDRSEPREGPPREGQSPRGPRREWPREGERPRGPRPERKPEGERPRWPRPDQPPEGERPRWPRPNERRDNQRPRGPRPERPREEQRPRGPRPEWRERTERTPGDRRRPKGKGFVPGGRGKPGRGGGGRGGGGRGGSGGGRGPGGGGGRSR